MFTKLKVISICTIIALILGSNSIFALTSESSIDVANKEVQEYCQLYNIETSDDLEFISEVNEMMEERENYLNIDSTNITDSIMPYEINEVLNETSSSGKPLKKVRYIPTSAYADIIWTDNPIQPFNHVGLYTKTNEITEALGDGVKSRAVGKEMKEYPFNIYKVTTTAGGNTRYSLEKRKTVATWCKAQVGKAYDTNFANNKENTTASNKKFNCSELVWKSWKFKASVDLDSNGGKGVYPNNIKNSDRTKYITGDK